ncbi:hypothetical protein VFPPC_06766 [Pochonia chlamydosporia 170]|uniref:Uncharacterized protein n=1 Tax=Pochonia chlamydosporia 170 TaxID=1380566 RepID=A0A179F5F3_METCM|nr:hypothetical protein VFPPC_06766 [Pochonia chlamydosporia 170]OAQ60654.1 hypothetical protein VFPPC_06766 [Pochonia chlamydosporia 170]
MLGIGGGISSKKKNMRLGDVAVSKPVTNLPGVLQYDLIKAEGSGQVVLKGTLDKPHPTQLRAVTYLEGEEMMDRCPLPENLEFIMKKTSRFKQPEEDDILYDVTLTHIERGEDCTACEMSGMKKIVQIDVKDPETDPKSVALD